MGSQHSRGNVFRFIHLSWDEVCPQLKMSWHNKNVPVSVVPPVPRIFQNCSYNAALYPGLFQHLKKDRLHNKFLVATFRMKIHM